MSFWLLSRPFPLVAPLLKGARDRSYERVKGRTSSVDTMEPRRPTIGRHYQPQQRNFVVLVTFTTFHARWLGPPGAGGASEIERVLDIGRVVLLGAKHRD